MMTIDLAIAVNFSVVFLSSRESLILTIIRQVSRPSVSVFSRLICSDGFFCFTIGFVSHHLHRVIISDEISSKFRNEFHSQIWDPGISIGGSEDRNMMLRSTFIDNPCPLFYLLAVLVLFLTNLQVRKESANIIISVSLPFHPRDLLPHLPRQVSWPILNSLYGTADLLSTFIGTASSVNDSVPWQGVCFYEHTVRLEFHNKSSSESGGGPFHIKADKAHRWTCMDLSFFAILYRVTWIWYLQLDRLVIFRLFALRIGIVIKTNGGLEVDRRCLRHLRCFMEDYDWGKIGLELILHRMEKWDCVLLCKRGLFGMKEKTLVSKQTRHQRLFSMDRKSKSSESTPKSSIILISTKRQDTALVSTTSISYFKSKVMPKAFWSLSYKLLVNYKYVKEGHNRFHLLARKAFDSRVTLHSFIEIVSISYIRIQWLLCIYPVSCKLL